MGRRRKKKDERIHVEPKLDTLGDAAPEPVLPSPPPVQVVRRVRCPYCKTEEVTWDGTKAVTLDGTRGRIRYYVCRKCCDPVQDDMSPTRFKVIEAPAGE